MGANSSDDRIDEAVLALLHLGIHQRHADGARTWKSFDWDAMDRLQRKDLITNPATRAKSVVLTESGMQEAEAAYRRLFGPDE